MLFEFIISNIIVINISLFSSYFINSFKDEFSFVEIMNIFLVIDIKIIFLLVNL